MPRFAANLSMMFTEVPFLDRFHAAREAGFTGVEYLFPYDFEPEAIAAKLRETGLENVLFNMPPGNWAAGERGVASLPGREEEFRLGVEKALKYAQELGVRRLLWIPEGSRTAFRREAEQHSGMIPNTHRSVATLAF